MSDKDTMKLLIHFGGVMKKNGETYEYLDEMGSKTTQWKVTEIKWEKFEDFLRSQLIETPMGLIWYKQRDEEMEKMRYVFDNNDMHDLCLIAESGEEIDVFIEGQIPEYIDCECDEENDVEVDRPKEDDEPVDSEEENQNEEEGGNEDNMAETENVVGEDDNEVVGEDENVPDDGDDVIEDAGDGGNDERFQSLFEEANRVTLEKKLHPDVEEEDKEDSDDEYDLDEEVEYPDTPLESDEEWDQWDRKRKGKDKAKFHGDFEKEPYIWLFQTFNSGMEFKDQLLRYSLKTQYDVKMAKSEKNIIGVICCHEKCLFKVFCSYEKPINRWMVKVCKMKHRHGKSSKVSMLKQGVIAGLFREELRRNVHLPAAEIKDAIKARYNIVVPISKCYRGRHIALASIFQDQAIQFGKLWDYEAELKRGHKDISTDLKTIITSNGGFQFDCFYICFEELKKSWKNCCRPVIGLDGCFLKWDLTGDLLAAVGRDGDNRMYPIAWAVVRGENKDTWGWFIKKLKVDLGLQNGQSFTIISDKQKGLVHAVHEELPDAEHRMCARHIYANWRKQGFSRSEYKNLFWGVAYSYTEGEYEDNLKLLQQYDPAAHEALLATEPKRWCRAFFSIESHCADVHNNLSESFNRTIKIARSKPVLNMLEDIRRQAMKRISRRFLKADKCETVVTPNTMASLERARKANKFCSTLRSSHSLYEVIEFDNGYTLNLATHQCACRRWDPKPHAKKKPRGKPLKVKKTSVVPHGIGTFWSPFLDRPFEVFGSRIYDRSTTNPNPPE